MVVVAVAAVVVVVVVVFFPRLPSPPVRADVNDDVADVSFVAGMSSSYASPILMMMAWEGEGDIEAIVVVAADMPPPMAPRRLPPSAVVVRLVVVVVVMSPRFGRARVTKVN